jgi:Mor family transcriptional regulator
MNRIAVELENCYGIRKLHHPFDFSQRRAYAIYAPNGSMKTSLAQTFKDIAEKKKTEDRIFPTRKTKRNITDENGVELKAENVLVLAPYDEFFGHTAKTSTLLVNNVLRKEYEQLHTDIDNAKAKFLKAMTVQSAGSKKDLEPEIALAFMKSAEGDSFYRALERIEKELAEQKDAPFKDVPYDSIFDDKVLTALDSTNFKTAIQDYIKRYNELLAASTYFKKGIFEYYNASQVAKALSDNGFFDAKHTITFNAAKKKEISTLKELEEIVAKELDSITKDPQLKKKFSEIKKLLEKNITVREFHRYLCDHELLLPHLQNVDLFKENIWKSYFKANQALYDDLLSKYRTVKQRLSEIQEQAKTERTQWEAAIELFNDRFFVPFTLEAKNKAAVCLAHDPMLDLTYTFKDSQGEVPVGRDTLMKSLSQGEKKALYILNIIFEIEVRRHAKHETLFVVDDIADSFDYKNKYAIIQYLQEISDGPVFKQIILTHNFDFFRTISSRFVGYAGCLMATKKSTEIVLTQAQGIKNVFVNDWKGQFHSDKNKRIASIPFMRNLIEYVTGKTDTDYLKLTSLLHWKEHSASITQNELNAIYQKLFGINGQPDDTTLVLDLIHTQAKECLTAPEGINFENKIVLSIAIRLLAEKFIVAKIADDAFWKGLGEYQTQKLLTKFKETFPGETETIKTLNSVILMTPENIHLNAFMYEPILDMSDAHLKKLYQDICALK